MQKIIYHSQDVEVSKFGFLTNIKGLFAMIIFFNYVKAPCKHLGWKITR